MSDIVEPGPWTITASLSQSIPSWAKIVEVHPSTTKASLGVGMRLAKNLTLNTTVSIPPGQMRVKNATGTLSLTIKL